MTDRQRNDRRRARERNALAAGLVVSVLLHVLIAALNPAAETDSYLRRASGPAPAPGARFTVLSLSPSSGDDDEDRPLLEALPQSPPRAATFGVPSADPADDAGPDSREPSVPDRIPTVAERLRHADSPLRKPPAPLPPEPANGRALRETRERVLRAGEELGPLPPAGVASSGGGGGGIRIPFGFGPPPPARVVAAPPLPDSIIRRDSIRAAEREAARLDSIRKARDPARLRNVAPRRPVIIPRVPPDTTRIDTAHRT